MTKNDLLKKAEEYMKTKYRFELTEDEAEGGTLSPTLIQLAAYPQEKQSKKPQKTARTQDVSGSSLHLKAEWKSQNRLTQRNTPVNLD